MQVFFLTFPKYAVPDGKPQPDLSQGSVQPLPVYDFAYSEEKSDVLPLHQAHPSPVVTQSGSK